MFQRRSHFSPLVPLACLLAALASVPVPGQTAVPDSTGRLVFKANARTVVLDVVVTGREGKPVIGLRKEDFQLAEDGHSQPIAFFEEHKGSQRIPAKLPDLPPNIFMNVPRVKPVDSVTVLLLDSLNTLLPDQGAIHAQMMKYLAGVKPGQRMAIFTLGNKLRYIQGFTTDPAVLIAALNLQKNGAGPQASSLLRSNAQESAEQTALAQIAAAESANPSPVFQEALERLQQYQAEQSAFQTDQRVGLTLDALQQLARYLAGIPGRKNVIWFSSAFPTNLLPNPDLNDSFSVERDYQAQIHKTDDLLAAAEVAIYPVAAEGLQTDQFYQSDQRFTGFTTAQQPGETQALVVQPLGEQAQHVEINHLRDEATQRVAEHASMEQIARETGGEAFFNTNGLDDALDRVANHGSSYYTVAYTPTNTAADGKFRRLQVKIVNEPSAGGYKLAYRRGYFGAGAKENKANTVKATTDPLHPFMGPGMPDSTQILYAVRLKASGKPQVDDSSPEIVKHSSPVFNSFGKMEMASHTELQPGADPGDSPAHAGENLKMKGKLTRYSVDFIVAARGLQLNQTPTGGRHGSIEATLVVYDRDGKALNWLVRQVDLDLDGARYAEIQQNGVNFRMEIDAPKEAASLRSGLYDNGSNLTGTLEVPLRSLLVGQTPGLKAR